MRYRVMEAEKKKKPGSALRQNTRVTAPSGPSLLSPLQKNLMATQAGLGNRYVQRMVTRLRDAQDNHEKIQSRQPTPENTQEGERENPTGLPDQLKFGIEQLSGYSLDDVRVHYNSSKPAELQAFAYTQGMNIYVAPGQERHLPHEAWHVVQQAQGKVRPTVQLKGGIRVNDDQRLEGEADLMGAKGLQMLPLDKNVFEFPVHTSAITSETSMRPDSCIVQRNAILAHNFEVNENPIVTIIRFVGRNTESTEKEVFDAIDFPHDPDYKKALIEEGGFKPISVKAFIDKVTGSADRPSSAIQTAIGWLGDLEDTLRGRAHGKPGESTYDGGHLLGYGWYSDWTLINTAKNIAPQVKEENRSNFGYKGGWGKDEEIARKLGKQLPIVVTAYVNYAGATYTVSLKNIADTMLNDNSKVKKDIDAMKTSGLRFVVLNSRVPTQYVLEHTVLSPVGTDSKLKNENLKGGLLTVWVPTRIPRMLLGPIEDAVYKYILPLLRSPGDQDPMSHGDRGRWGGATVSQNQPLYPIDLLNDAMKFAQFAIYYYMYVFNLPMTAAALLVARYFGAGTAASAVQSIPAIINAGFSQTGLVAFIPYLNWFVSKTGMVLATTETTLTTDAVIGYSKSTIAYLTSQSINWGGWIVDKLK